VHRRIPQIIVRLAIPWIHDRAKGIWLEEEVYAAKNWSDKQLSTSPGFSAPYPWACEEKASCDHERTQLRVKVLGHYIGAGRGQWRKQVVPKRVAAALLMLEAAVDAFAPSLEPTPAVSKGPLTSSVQPGQARAETCLS